jgi:tetratricopeptide (TPR) repeat protein
MFEVLLQADRALASGALDQAERSYWQLVELDPTNAIAVAGLARISLQRGDHRLARTFADRALAMDPESVAAKRILEILNGGVTAAPFSDQPDLTLIAAERLETLGRRRIAAAVDEGDLDAGVRGGKPGKPGEAPGDDAGGQLSQRAAEQLWERHQVGRQQVDAAAEAEPAAPRPQAPLRPKTHQALGDRARRHLQPDARLRPRADDPFAAAESAAAIEAVDETDDVAIVAHVGRADRARASEPTDELGEVLGAVDATDEDESIAMRVALISDAAQVDASEIDGATLGASDARGKNESITMRAALVPDEVELPAAEELSAPQTPSLELDEDELDIAEMVAARDFRPAPSRPIDLAALEADLLAAELRAAEHETGGHKAAAPAAERAPEQIAEAEKEATELDVLSGTHEHIAVPTAPPPIDEEATVEEAEAAALREAVAMVLGGGAGDSDDGGDTATADADEPAQRPASGRPHKSDESRPPNPEPSAESDASAEPADGGAKQTDTGATPEPRRKGLLRRFRGG